MKQDRADFFIVSGTLIRYMGHAEEVVVPSGVLSIGTSAFKQCSSLKRVVLPTSVTTIGHGAFDGCESLEEIRMPPRVTEIGAMAFYGCESLKTIEIPRGLSLIGNEVFCGCRSLESVTISNHVTHIASKAFFQCEALTQIRIPDGVQTIDGMAFKGCRGLADRDGWVIVNDIVFDCLSQTHAEYTIPRGVKEIADGAFCDNTVFSGIVIPDTVERIGSFAFARCTSLQHVTIPSSVKTIGRQAFFQCEALTQIRIPDGVRKLLPSAFASCVCLQRVEIVSANTILGERLLEGCRNLKVLHLPGDVLQPAKLGMSSAEIISVFSNDRDPSPLIDQYVYSHKREYVDLIFKRDDAFAMKKMLAYQKKPTLRLLDTYIERAEQEGKQQLKAFLIERKNQLYSVEDQERYEDLLFEKELGLRERTLSDWRQIFKVTIRGQEAWIGGYKLRETIAEIPSKIAGREVTKIGTAAFADCDSLQTVVIPDTVIEIGDRAFSGCLSLTSVTVPASVQTVGSRAFAACRELQCVTICSGTTEIGTNAFLYAHGMTLKAPKDSAAHNYALRYRIPFEPLD